MLAEPISEPKWCHPPSPFIQPVLGMKRPIHKRERVIKEGPADGERKRENECDGNGKLPCSKRKKETHFFWWGMVKVEEFTEVGQLKEDVNKMEPHFDDVMFFS